jgi:hypothetical protein
MNLEGRMAFVEIDARNNANHKIKFVELLSFHESVMALLHEGRVAGGRDMVDFSYHTKTCHEISIPHPQLV